MPTDSISGELSIKMLRFTIRDILWLTVVIALALGWWLDWQSRRPTEKHFTGTITVGGQPIHGGSIYFHTGNGQFHGAEISAGAFEIDRLPFGDYRVFIENEKVPPYYNENWGLTCISERTISLQFGLHDAEQLARILARTSATNSAPQ